MIRTAWQRARDEWRANRRLRLAGMAALVFLGLHLLLAMGEQRRVLAERYGRDVELQARFAGMQEQKDWPGRADQAEVGLAEMRARIPAVTGAGLAQAEMQAWLTELAARTGLVEPKVKVEDTLDVPDYPEMWQVMARLDGQIPQYGQAAFLRALSEALPWIQAERLEIAEGDQPRVVLVVRGYYRQAEDGAADAQAAPGADAPVDPGVGATGAPKPPQIMPAAPSASPPDQASVVQPVPSPQAAPTPQPANVVPHVAPAPASRPAPPGSGSPSPRRSRPSGSATQVPPGDSP